MCVHVDLASYLAACMFFPLPSAPVEPHLSLENDKWDDSYEQISIRNESEARGRQWNEREKEGDKDKRASGQRQKIDVFLRQKIICDYCNQICWTRCSK